MYNKRELKKVLKKKRELKGFTQKEFAKYIGVTEQAVVAWEKADSDTIPSFDNMVKICNKLNCDFDSLFGKIQHNNNDIRYICEATGFTEDALSYVCNLTEEQHQILSLVLCGSSIFQSIEKYLSIDFLDTQNTIYGMVTDEEVYKQALLCHIKKELDELAQKPKERNLLNNLVAVRKQRREYFAALSEEEQERYITARLNEYSRAHEDIEIGISL